MNISDDELYEILEASIKYQIDRLDKLDIYTNRHVHSVPIIVNKICNELSLTKESTYFCVKVAYLHDIGKIFIPIEILQKREKLTDDEYITMQKHTIKGYELCIATNELSKYSRGVRSHHESENGKGYPDGLFKDNIPFEAEIVKVADVYDAIISRRQYKPEIKRSVALEIMKVEVLNGYFNKKIFIGLLKSIIKDIKFEINQNSNIEDSLIDEINKIEQIVQEVRKGGNV